MTTQGFARLVELYMNDITTLRYDVGGVTQNTTSIQKIQTGNELTIRTTLPATQNGLFNNFKLITGTGIISTERALSFNKTSGELTVRFPFIFVNG